MDLGTILLVAILLACPLMMLLMHLGGHKHGAEADEAASLAELRRRRDALEAEIASREEDEAPPVPGHDRGARAARSVR